MSSWVLFLLTFEGEVYHEFLGTVFYLLLKER